MKLKLSKRYYALGKRNNKIIPPERFKIYKDFETYQKLNYSKIPVKCPCNNEISYLVSTVDREGWKYPLVICKSCGLIRAKDYWDKKSVKNYYSNWYRKKYGGDEDAKLRSNSVWNYVNEFTSKLKKPYTVVDIGGGTGGTLNLFLKEADCFLIDFDKIVLSKAKNIGISTLEGDINKISDIRKKPDLVILSHVLEHIVDIDRELTNLKKNMKIGSLVYIGLPGIDALKKGSYDYFFLNHIHKAHVYYFSIDVLNNLMSRYGFECVKSNIDIRAVYKYTGEIGALLNHHNKVCFLLKGAEIRRKIGLNYIRKLGFFYYIIMIKYKIGKMLPPACKNWIKKNLFLNKNEKFSTFFVSKD